MLMPKVGGGDFTGDSAGQTMIRFDMHSVI